MKRFFSIFTAALFCASMFAATYTVAGSSVALFGSSWGQTDTNNDMTLVDGLYKLEKKNVTLSKGTIEFKVVKDHSWDNAWPGSNYQLNIPSDGTYDVTITFNESSKDITATAEKKGDAVIEKHYLVVGEDAIVNGSEWNNNNADNLMTTTDEGLTYKLRIENLTLTAKDYEYKIVEKGTWEAYYDNGSGGNAKFTIAELAVYTIEYVFTVASSTCEVTATKTGEAGPIETKYYLVGTVKGWDANEANLFEENPGNPGEYMINTTLAVGEGIKVLKEEGTMQTWYPDGEGNEYVVDAAHAGAKTIYFNPDKPDGWTLLEGYIWIDENVETAINNAASAENVVKSIENGQLVIIKNGVKYNAQGAVVR